MSADDLKKGFLTVTDLRAVWAGAVDAEFAQPFLDAEDGEGNEPYEQAFEQFSRISKAIDVSTQAMFILPHSMQTQASAQGEAKSTVTLSLTRTSKVHMPFPLLLRKGEIVVEETETDYGPNTGIEVFTGRRYVLTQTVLFAPGDEGAITATAEAERPGYGYNAPQIGTLRTLVQLGSAFTNDRATVSVTVPAMTAAKTPRAKLLITSDNEAESFIPEHIGQYVKFIAGANTGKIGRITNYSAPVPPTHGGVVEIENYKVFELSSDVAWDADEQVAFVTGGVPVGYGRFLAKRTSGGRFYGAFVLDSGVVGTQRIDGVESGVTSNVVLLIEDTALAAESRAAEWKVLDWKFDFGLTATNTTQPSGGRAGILDELGAERKVWRAPGEGDAAYAKRISEVADTISPNAIRRAINRVLVPLDKQGYLREIGNPATGFMGFFFDGSSDDSIDSACAFDMEFDTNPDDRFKVIMDYTEMRAFFMIGVPVLASSGDFGFFFDGASIDASPNITGVLDVGFLDGYPIFSTEVYRQLWNAIDPIRAGGVGFDLYKETVDPTSM